MRWLADRLARADAAGAPAEQLVVDARAAAGQEQPRRRRMTPTRR
jgi:hypothetical protein